MAVGAAVPSLARWGFSPDADLVYRALITLGPRTGRELKRDLGLTIVRIDHAIDGLAAIDAVVLRDRVWVPRPYAEVIVDLRRQRVNRYSRAAPDVELPTPLALGDGLRHLPSRALARHRMGELVRTASREHLAMHPDLAFEADSVRAALPVDRALLRRGVRMRALGVLGPEATPMPSIRRAGAEHRPDYRQATVLPMKLIVLDRKVALFPVDPQDLEKGYLEVTQTPLVSALVDMFERQWRRAWDPLEDAMTDGSLSARERALVALLAEGHTDMTAARELGISVRSVSNILRHLMDRLHVDNRFQLGIALGALRVVRPPRKERQNDA